jgi:antitoxin VapB
MPRAKLFRNGRSQAVRLPKQFRFEGTEVEIRRVGTRVILEPAKRQAWPKGYFESFGPVSEDLQAPRRRRTHPARVRFVDP